MKQYFPLVFGAVALGIEVLVFLSLMELPPFGKGGSDIIWGLPFFGLIVLALSVSGLFASIRGKENPQFNAKLITGGLITNGLSLAVPVLLLAFGIFRALVLR